MTQTNKKHATNDEETTEKKTFSIKYVSPVNIEEAFSRKEELGAAILQIQSQLGSRQENNEWRRKTKVALLCKTEELRRVKNYIRINRQSKIDFLNEVIDILRHLNHSGVDITERGRSILELYQQDTKIDSHD